MNCHREKSIKTESLQHDSLFTMMINVINMALTLTFFIYFPTVYVQAVRGLLMCGLTLGFFGAIFGFLGMECTYIGGAETTKDKQLLASAVFHFVGGEGSTRDALLEHK